MATTVDKSSILYELGVQTAKVVSASKEKTDKEVNEKLVALETKIKTEQEITTRRVRRLWFAHMNNQGGF